MSKNRTLIYAGKPLAGLITRAILPWICLVKRKDLEYFASKYWNKISEKARSALKLSSKFQEQKVTALILQTSQGRNNRSIVVTQMKNMWSKISTSIETLLARKSNLSRLAQLISVLQQVFRILNTLTQPLDLDGGKSGQKATQWLDQATSVPNVYPVEAYFHRLSSTVGRLDSDICDRVSVIIIDLMTWRGNGMPEKGWRIGTEDQTNWEMSRIEYCTAGERKLLIWYFSVKTLTLRDWEKPLGQGVQKIKNMFVPSVRNEVGNYVKEEKYPKNFL